MKNIKEIYQALLDGKTLIHKHNGITIDINDTRGVGFICTANWEIYDKFDDLKRAHREGAIIECRPIEYAEWEVCKEPLWINDNEYRIKGNIAIEQWDKHKDLIKAWWDKAEIEIFDEVYDKWLDVNPSWNTYRKYRIKSSQWEIKPGATFYITNTGNVNMTGNNKVSNIQQFGMKYHTKEQAEKARDQMRQANILRYWVSTMQDLDEGKWFIYLNNCKYYVSCDDIREDIGKVYMTQETAEKICDALNSGELKL